MVSGEIGSYLFNSFHINHTGKIYINACIVFRIFCFNALLCAFGVYKHALPLYHSQENKTYRSVLLLLFFCTSLFSTQPICC